MVATDVEMVACKYGCGQPLNPRGAAVHEVSCVRNPDRRPHSRSAEYKAWALANGRPDPEVPVGETIKRVVEVMQSLTGEVRPGQVHAQLPDMPMSRISYGLQHASKRGLIGNPRRGVYTAKTTRPEAVLTSPERVLAAIDDHYGNDVFAVVDLYDQLGRPGLRQTLSNRITVLTNRGDLVRVDHGRYQRRHQSAESNGGAAMQRVGTTDVVARPKVRDVRAKIANNAKVGGMLATLVGIEPDEAALLIDWIDLTRELVDRGK